MARDYGSGVGFSEGGIERLQTVLAGYAGSAGLVAVVARGDDVLVHAAGQHALDGIGSGPPRPVTRDTIFRISSMTKPVTAVATMTLVEDCLIRLDDPVDDLLPELAGRSVLRRPDMPLDETEPAIRPITVRDLLTFRMGFGIPALPPGTWPIQTACVELDLNQGAPDPDVPPEPDEWIRRLGSLPLIHQPGEGWMYSTGADVLGVLLARAAGQPFPELLHERVLGPLGMRDTGFHVAEEDLDRFTDCYWTDFATGAPTSLYDAVDGRWSRPPRFPAGSAGLVSTAEDYLAFARMLLDGGAGPDGRILSRASVDLITADHTTPAGTQPVGWPAGFFDGMGWGFGLAVTTRRDGVLHAGSYGWDGGMGSTWRNDPAEGLVTILLTTNSMGSPLPPPLFRDFLTCAYSALD